MPEDYQAILDDLGVDTSAAPAADPAPSTQDPTPANPTAADPTPANPTSDDGDGNDGGQAAQPAGETEEQRRSNEAFAAMRSENSKYKKFIQHIMKGANFQGDEEAFMNQLTEASYQRQAKNQGGQVSPEVLKRMDTLEAQNKSLLDA